MIVLNMIVFSMDAIIDKRIKDDTEVFKSELLSPGLSKGMVIALCC